MGSLSDFVENRDKFYIRSFPRGIPSQDEDALLLDFLAKVVMSRTEKFPRTRPTKELEVRVASLESRVNSIEEWKSETEVKYEQLRYETNLKPIEEKVPKIAEYFRTRISEIDFVKALYFRPIPKGVSILFVHDLDDRVAAMDELVKVVTELEDCFPDIYFETMILHESEISPYMLHDKKLVFQK